MLSWALLALACVLCMQATPEPAGHPRGVLCPSGVGPGLLRAVVNTPIRSAQHRIDFHFRRSRTCARAGSTAVEDKFPPL